MPWNTVQVFDLAMENKTVDWTISLFIILVYNVLQLDHTLLEIISTRYSH